MQLRAAIIGFGLLSWSAALAAQAPIPAGKVVAGTLSFDGHASVGDFVGKTDSVSGEMSGGPDLTAIQGWVGRGTGQEPQDRQRQARLRYEQVDGVGHLPGHPL
jgi:hypothetical protein